MRRGVQHARHQYPTSLHLESANLRFFLSLYWLFSIPLFLKCFAVATQYHCNSAIAEKTAHVPTSARYTTGLTEIFLWLCLKAALSNVPFIAAVLRKQAPGYTYCFVLELFYIEALRTRPRSCVIIITIGVETCGYGVYYHFRFRDL